MSDDLLDEVGLEKVEPTLIMVVGVGGAGGNAINHMYDLGIKGVSFMVCNTDRQALNASPIPMKVQLGEGLGAGNNPDKGRAAAIESMDEITAILKREGIRMVFVTAGMGGGTGTGAAPIIAKAAKEMGILTVGIVTIPYRTEGPLRTKHAIAGIKELEKGVDSLLVINNENIQEIYGKLPITEAFGKANDVLATAAKGIAEIITRRGFVNVDFADVSAVMGGGGVAMMGSGRAEGENRAQQAAELALSSPLLNHRTITGATHILINITYGTKEITLDDASLIREYIQSRAGNTANVIWGAGGNDILGDDIEVTLIATGFGDGSSDSQVKSGAKSGGETSAGRYKDDSTGKGGGMGGYSGRAPSQTINIIADSKYGDMDHIINVSAFKRRNVKFTTDTVSDSKVAKVVMKESPQPEPQPSNEGSLFNS